MKKVLLLLLFFLPAWSFASHIVGGEFELIHVSGYTYNLRLILYFDVKNGNTGARDPDMTVRIFRSSDDQQMEDVFLTIIQDDRVDYFQPECSNGEIITDRIVYQRQITLSPDDYNDPAGYYVVWERCCRNYTIDNIISQDPNAGGVGTGQTFYLEFPPVFKDGEQFINSTPQLFPPLNDYGCPNRFYYVDFGGFDADGDSLAYSIITPLNSSSQNPVPVPSPRPHRLVPWETSFGLNNIMNGDPDLDISTEGYLTVVPKTQGLYVFAVRCEEYRDGEKIGELRRDFQMLVVDNCPEAQKPVIRGKKLTDANYSYVDDMTVSFANTVSDANRCINVQVTDVDSESGLPENLFQENVFIRAIALNFRENVNEVLPAVTTAVLNNGSAAEFEICFESCPYLNPKTDGPFDIGIVAFDDACALPLTDTLRVTVNIEPPVNNDAYYQNPTGQNIQVTKTVQEGDVWVFNIKGKDDDGDVLSIDTLLNEGLLRLADYGMSFERIDDVPGEVNAVFTWDTKCDVYDFTELQNFQLEIIIDDEDFCDFGEPQSFLMDLSVHLPDNTDPDVSTNYTGLDVKYSDPDSLYIEKYIYETLAFDTFAEDLDGDDFSLFAEGDGFQLRDYEVNYPDKKWGSNVVLNSDFRWNINCSVNIEEKDEFKFFFLSEDSDKCKFPNYDTLIVMVKVLPPLNNKPVLLVHSNTEDVVANHSDGNANHKALEVIINQKVDVTLSGADANNDFLSMQLFSLEGPKDIPEFTFENVEGRGRVSSDFEWVPSCELLSEGLQPATYTAKFGLMDDRCFNLMGDTLVLDITVNNLDPYEEQYFVPNVITPNNDGFNEYFAITAVNPESEQLITEKHLIPLDNCAHVFESITIVNRWGKQVYKNNNRDFKWAPSGEPAGVYYYSLNFSNDLQYQGPLTVQF